MNKSAPEQFTAQAFSTLLLAGYVVARLYVHERWVTRDPARPNTKTRTISGKLEIYTASIENNERVVCGLQRDIQYCPASPTDYLRVELFDARDSRGGREQALDKLFRRWRRECPEWLENSSDPIAIYDSERGGRRRIGIAHALLVQECGISFAILAMLIKRHPKRKPLTVLSSRLSGLLERQVRSCDQAARAFILA